MKKIWDGFHEVVRWLGMSCYLAILFCIIYQIVLRYFFGRNLSWCEELSQCCYISSCFIAISLTERENGHIRLDMIFEHVSEKVKTILMDVGRVMTIGYACFIAYSVYKYFPAIINTKTRASGIPLRYIYGIMGVGCVLWALNGLMGLISSFAKHRQPKEA